jgi:hypothetical protein
MQNQDLLADEFSLKINEEGNSVIFDVCRWAAINAVIGFLGIAISVIQFVKVLMMDLPGTFGSLVGSAVTIAISLILNLALLNSARSIRAGLLGSDQFVFNNGLARLSSYFRIMGILSLIGIGFAVLVFLIVLVGFATRQ